MSQTFNPSIPVYQGPRSSEDMRNQFNALDSCHSGDTPPPYPQPGKFWFDNTQLALNQFIAGGWRMLLRYNASTGRIEIGTGELLTKQDFKTGVVPEGQRDGVNDTFTIPDGGAYYPGTLAVFINGQQYNPANITQHSPNFKTFTINGDTLPDDGNDPPDVLTVSFLRK